MVASHGHVLPPHAIVANCVFQHGAGTVMLQASLKVIPRFRLQECRKVLIVQSCPPSLLKVLLCKDCLLPCRHLDSGFREVAVHVVLHSGFDTHVSYCLNKRKHVRSIADVIRDRLKVTVQVGG